MSPTRADALTSTNRLLRIISDRPGGIMGTVHRLMTSTTVTIDQAVTRYLATIPGANTLRAYKRVLGQAVDHFGPATIPGEISPDDFANWFTSRWGDCSPATWNATLAAFRSAAGYWAEQGWITEDPSRRLRRRKLPEDRSRALSRSEVEHLLTDDRHSLRDRTLWRMLYETAARSAEILGLDVEDLDLPNRRARVHRKGGAIDIIVWQTGTARLLPRLLKGRTSGPLFLTERRARVELPPGDIDQSSGKARLSYTQAEALFKVASGGATLHQLRHSALTHAAEDGTSTPMLMARSGHASVRSLAKYAHVSAEALQRHQAATDPARRRRG